MPVVVLFPPAPRYPHDDQARWSCYAHFPEALKKRCLPAWSAWRPRTGVQSGQGRKEGVVVVWELMASVPRTKDRPHVHAAGAGSSGVAVRGPGVLAGLGPPGCNLAAQPPRPPLGVLLAH